MEYTPQELSAILFHYNEHQRNIMTLDWNRTSIQTFYLLNIQIPKKDKITWDKWKKMWPSLDEKSVSKPNPEEGLMSYEDWMALLNKPVISVST